MSQTAPMDFLGDILVVDDDLPSLRFLSELLSAHGYRVRSARNGATALMMVGAEPPDLILLDIRMPDIDGFEVCRQIKSDMQNTNIPVLFISAVNELDDKIKSFEVGGVDYIDKPFQTEEILARIRTHLTIARLHASFVAANAELQNEITAREQAQTALQASEHQLRAQYDGSPIPTFTWRKQGDDLFLLDYNQAALEITWGRIEGWIGATAREFYMDRPDILDDMQRCLSEQTAIEREFEYTYRSTGESAYVAVKYAFVPPDLVLVHAENIIERKRAEAELLKRIKELNALHNISMTLTHMQELPRTLEALSKTICELFGVPAVLILLRHGVGSELDAYVGYAQGQGVIGFSTVKATGSWLPQSMLADAENKFAVLSNLYTADLPEPAHTIAAGAGVQATMVVPLASRSGLLGALFLGKQTADLNFVQQEIDLAETIATDIAAALENERLNEQARRAAVDAERQRLARDLHDSVTQSIYSLTLLSSGWESMAREGTLENPAESFHRLGEVGQQALREMRLLLHQLRPSVLEEEGLVAALRQRLERVELRANIESQLITRGDLSVIPADLELELFKISQEALNNSLRHSQADQVRVILEENQGRITLVVEDNGQGFDLQARQSGMGLGNMQARAAAIHGELSIESELGHGARVSVSIPSTKETK